MIELKFYPTFTNASLDVTDVESTAASTYEVIFGRAFKGDDGAPGAPGSPGVGVPTGGASGQVLRKVSGTDYDTEWGESSEPSAYIKAASVSGNVLTLTKKDNTTVTFEDHNTVYDDTALAGRVTVIEGKESGWDGKYTKPSSGIPSTDLSSGVQTSLGKADTALQEHQSLSGYATESWVEEQGYLTEHQSLAAYRTSAAQDIIDSGKAASVHTHTKSQITDFPTLAVVAESGDYDDLSNKPTIPTVPVISTDIAADAASDVKTASPKAVKTYVDNISISIDEESITKNTDNELQTVGVKEQRAGAVYKEWVGTLAQYEAIAVKDASTKYIITDDEGGVDLSGKEDKSNKATSLSASSTDTEYPSAKCVYDIVGDIEATLQAIRGV